MGTVEIASSVPDPANADYDNCLTFLRVRVAEADETAFDGRYILVVTWGFKERETSPTAAIKEGDTLLIVVQPYDEVAGDYDEFMRVDDTDDYASPVYWLLEWTAVKATPPTGLPTPKLADGKIPPVLRERSPVAPAFTPDEIAARARRIDLELRAQQALVTQYGGWDSWLAAAEQSYAALLKLETTPRRLNHRSSDAGEVATIESRDFVFDENQVRVLVRSPDIISQPGAINGVLETIILLDRQLKAAGIHLIVVPVPERLEVYADSVLGERPAAPLAPGRNKLMVALLSSGVECVDLLPLFVREKDGTEQPLLYYREDPHWNDYGKRLAAQTLAQRLNDYAFARDPRFHAGFTIVEAEREPNSIYEKEPSTSDEGSSPELVPALRVAPVGGHGLYGEAGKAPVLVMGDSFCGGPAASSFAAQLGAVLQLEVRNSSEQGGAFRIPAKLARKGKAHLAEVRVLVWVFHGRSLAFYRNWEPLAIPWLPAQ